MALFDNQQETNLKSCADLIESVLGMLGFDAARSRVPSESGPSWSVTSGSARVFVFLASGDDGENYLQVVAPVLVPSEDPTRLFRRLLELNANELTGAAFGVRNQALVVRSVVTTTGRRAASIASRCSR